MVLSAVGVCHLRFYDFFSCCTLVSHPLTVSSLVLYRFLRCCEKTGARGRAGSSNRWEYLVRYPVLGEGKRGRKIIAREMEMATVEGPRKVYHAVGWCAAAHRPVSCVKASAASRPSEA